MIVKVFIWPSILLTVGYLAGLVLGKWLTIFVGSGYVLLMLN